MVNRVYRRKQHIIMAVLADICGRDVRRRFANRIGTVVTTDTIAGDVVVIEIRGNPAIRRVAIVAGVTAGDVCRVLACGYRAVVTG